MLFFFFISVTVVLLVSTIFLLLLLLSVRNSLTVYMEEHLFSDTQLIAPVRKNMQN